MARTKITVQQAAKLLGKSTLFVREAIKQDKLPIGTAIKTSGKWTFSISPQALADYMGVSVREITGEAEPDSETIDRLCRAFVKALKEEGVV